MEIDLTNAQGGPGGTWPINLYFDPDTAEGKPALVNTPGSYFLQDLGSGEIRGLLHDKSRNTYGDTYAIRDNDLHKSSNGAAFTQLTGTFATTTGKVWMAMCGAYLVMSDGTTALVYYHLNTGTTLSSVNPGFTPSCITSVDGYAVAAKQNSRALYHSNLLAPATWTATDTATLVDASDSIASIHNLNGELWVMGYQTTSVMYNSGGAGFVFAALPQGFVNIGTCAPASVIELDNSLFFLSSKHEVCRTRGYGYEVISPPQLNRLLYAAAQGGDIGISKAFAVHVKGRPWYVLNLADSITYVCDVSLLQAYGPSRAWFEWRTGTTGGYIGYGASCLHSSSAGANYWIVGGETDGRLYRVYDDLFADDITTSNTRIRSSLVCRAIHHDRKRLFHHSLELDVKATMGAPTTGVSTTLTEDAIAGQSTNLKVTSATGFVDGYVIVITLDDGTTFQTWQDGAVHDTNQVDLEEPLPGLASSGNTIVSYPKQHPTWGADYCPRAELFYTDGFPPSSWNGGTSLGKRRLYNWPDSDQEFIKVVWHGLGSSPDRYYRIQIDEACEKKIFGASLNVTVGE